MKLFSIFQQFKRKRDICAEKRKALYNFKALSCILFYSCKVIPFSQKAEDFRFRSCSFSFSFTLIIFAQGNPPTNTSEVSQMQITSSLSFFLQSVEQKARHANGHARALTALTKSHEKERLLAGYLKCFSLSLLG